MATTKQSTPKTHQPIFSFIKIISDRVVRYQVNLYIRTISGIVVYESYNDDNHANIENDDTGVGVVVLFATGDY